MSDLKALGSKSEFKFDEPDADILETFVNPDLHPSVKKAASAIAIQTSEFTSLCPKTGQPDWARIIICYLPGSFCVESKSLKLYLASYRNHGAFHEECVRQIRDDLVHAMDPKWLLVEGRFTPRGGIPFWPTAVYVREEHLTPVEQLVIDRALSQVDAPGRELLGL